MGEIIGQGKGLSLLYRGSMDGFSAENFHNKCDNKGKTLTVIKSDSGNVFGGYTDIPWDSPSSSKKIKKNGNSFVFSLRDDNSIVKLQNMGNEEVVHDKKRHVCFRYAIYVKNNCNKNSKSSTGVYNDEYK